MKKFFNIFFVVLGVIFLIIILIGGYFFITDPMNLKPIFFGSDSEITTGSNNSGVQVDKNPALSETQEKALETFGIDPADIPSEISPAQEQCFVGAIGAARVEEIKAGDSPTPTEFFKAKGCI